MQHRISFFLKEPNVDRETPINAFLHFNGTRAKLATGLRIHPKQWSASKQRVRRNALLEMPFNERLDHIEYTLSSIFLDLRNQRITPTADIIKSRYHALEQPSAPKKQDLLSIFEDHIATISKRMQPGTIKTYKATKNHLVAFSATWPGQLTFDSMNQQFFVAFQTYLLEKAQLANNRVWNIIKTLKAFLRQAEQAGLTSATHYKDFKVAKYDATVIALTQDELTKLAMLDLTTHPRLTHVRDQFLVECYTGVRYSDLAKILPEHVQDGKIAIVTKKTCESITIPILPAVQEILTRLRRENARILSNGRMNVLLKELAEHAGLNTPCTLVSYKGSERIETTLPKHKIISTHTGRRTFVTISLERGMRPETVMKITGHKDMKSFMRYVQVTNSAATRELVEAWTDDES